MADLTETDQEVDGVSRSGDPLAAMYVLAALFMGVAAVFIVAMIFIPADLFEPESENVWVPGSGPGWSGSGPSAFSDLAGVRQVAPLQYVAVIDAYNWEFIPREIRVPAGSEVTFRARSRQDYHGFAIVGTPILISLGQNDVEQATHRFETPGEYPIVCSEYCGGGHGAMQGRVIVESPPSP